MVRSEDDLFRIYPYFPINGNQSFEILYIELDPGASNSSEPHAAGTQEYLIVLDVYKRQGYYTSEEVSRERIHLVPCIKLKARLGNIMPVAAGEGIGYGFTYHTSRDSIIGLLPLGFSDGFTPVSYTHLWSMRSLGPAMTPAVTVPWPLRYLVALWTTRSAPRSRGFWR